MAREESRLASSEVGKTSAPQVGWWRRLDTAWERIRGEGDAHFFALCGLFACGLGLFALVAKNLKWLIVAGKLAPDTGNWQTLFFLVAVLSLLIYFLVSFRRDKEWAWWLSIFGTMLAGSAYLWRILDAWVGSHAANRESLDWMSYVMAAAFFIVPLSLYSDLKEIRRRKQAERGARGIEPTS